MTDQGEGLSIPEQTRSAMPGEDAASASVEMDALSDESTEGAIVNLLPGEELSVPESDAMADSSSAQMSATDTTAAVGTMATDMGATNTMPGEEGMGEAMIELMPGEEAKTPQPGKGGAELTGTFRLTLMPT